MEYNKIGCFILPLMKRIPLTSHLLHAPNSLVSLPFITSSQSSNLVCPASSSDLDICNDGEGPTASGIIIQDKDLLRKSKKSPHGLYLLDLMDEEKIRPDVQTYSRMLKKCTKMERLTEGRILHAHIMKSKFKNDLFFKNSIINMYAKCGSLEEAHQAFNNMPLRDLVSWTALITGYSQNDRYEEAVMLFVEMLRHQIVPNQFTIASVLSACASAANVCMGKQVHSFSFKIHCNTDLYVGSALVDMYARCGDMNCAHVVFDGMPERNEVPWNALIAGYARKGEGENALQQFWKMQQAGVEATHFTYSSVFSACASIGALEQGKWVHAHMIKTGHKLIAFMGNTLLDMYAKSGSIEDARKVFDRLSNAEVVSWNSMLTGCAQHGLGKEAVRRFEDMLQSGVVPNEVSFLCVLTACSHAGLLSEGKHYFELMKKYEIEPLIEHYVTMIDLYGRAGLLDQAEQFIKDMPIEPTAAVWGALLGACRMHGNVELGKYAAERVFELDHHDSGPPVILSNIYASAGRYKEAARVRKMMKDVGVKKEPACSWVEIENSVAPTCQEGLHRFLVW
ncbi:Pentatricopeptide repeat-containing protein [Nymphaea thermarum]|nr:Pentatricopeptide repeat-containing protein [Nymphaea thermarum]